MIKILFFASLRDKLDCDSLELDYHQGMTLGDIKSLLKQTDESWLAALSGSVLAAVNQEMVADDFAVSDQSEVAFFPPVTGG